MLQAFLVESGPTGVERRKIEETMNDSTDGLLKVDKLVNEVVDTAHATLHLMTSTNDDRHDVQVILNENYGRHLTRQFSPQDLRSAVEVMRLSIPQLNLRQFRTDNLNTLKKTATRLGARLIAKDLSGNDGLSLLGFYVDQGLPSFKPTIYVNSAHHPVAVATAFWHEIGHHLTARLVKEQREMLNLSLQAAYYKHLEQPLELLADTLVCLAAYPKRSAKRLFGSLLESEATIGNDVNWDEVLNKSQRHLQVETGFEFEEELPAAQNLHYLAGMLHFTKLRMALLREYDL